MVGFYRTGSFFTWETLGGMTIGGTGGIVGYLTIGTLVGAAKISMISSGVATLAYWWYVNSGSIPLPYRSSTYTIFDPSNLFWFTFGSNYSELSDVFNQYQYNVDALASTSGNISISDTNIEYKITEQYAVTVMKNAGMGTGGWFQSVMYRLNYFGAWFAPNCNKYARLVANDLANNIDLNNAQGWEVELVLNSKKNGYDHGMANQHSFVVLKYNGVRTWVLDPWGNNLPEIYDYNEFSKV